MSGINGVTVVFKRVYGYVMVVHLRHTLVRRIWTIHFSILISHHSAIPSPTQILFGAYFSNTLGDEKRFASQHFKHTAWHKLNFVTTDNNRWRIISSPYMTTLSDNIVRHHRSHFHSHQKKFVSAYFLSILGDEIDFASPTKTNRWQKVNCIT